MALALCRKSGQIPIFGDWEAANELPITKYFECARQAGLLRCSCSGECSSASYTAKTDLDRAAAALMFQKPQPERKMKSSCLDSAEEQRRPKDELILPNSKPVDEDLYKIPSKLLRNSKRKKVLGFFSRCIVPPCMP